MPNGLRSGLQWQELRFGPGVRFELRIMCQRRKLQRDQRLVPTHAVRPRLPWPHLWRGPGVRRELRQLRLGTQLRRKSGRVQSRRARAPVPAFARQASQVLVVIVLATHGDRAQRKPAYGSTAMGGLDARPVARRFLAKLVKFPPRITRGVWPATFTQSSQLASD